MGIEVKGINIPAILIKFDNNKTINENIYEIEKKLQILFLKIQYFLWL